MDLLPVNVKTYRYYYVSIILLDFFIVGRFETVQRFLPGKPLNNEPEPRHFFGYRKARHGEKYTPVYLKWERVGLTLVTQEGRR